MAAVQTPMDPELLGIRPPAFRMPPSTHLGGVRLGISNLERSTQFYRDVIGLREIPNPALDSNVRQFGAPESDAVLLELVELEGVHPLGPRARLGLYHFALLLPSRADLAEFVRQLHRSGVRAGSADHLVSEALYLVDPDGLSVEVYADRPRSEWVHEDREIVATIQTLQLQDLLNLHSQTAWKGVPAGTTVGHIHLYIGNLQCAADFYHAGLGFDKVGWRLPGALFVSAGGYHHHVGLNVWAAGSPVASERDSRLLDWQLILPDVTAIKAAAASARAAGFAVEEADDKARIVDPWGIAVSLVAATGG